MIAVPLLMLPCRRGAAAIAGDARLPAAPIGCDWGLDLQQARHAPTHVELGGGRCVLLLLLRRLEKLHACGHAAACMLTC